MVNFTIWKSSSASAVTALRQIIFSLYVLWTYSLIIHLPVSTLVFYALFRGWFWSSGCGICLQLCNCGNSFSLWYIVFFFRVILWIEDSLVSRHFFSCWHSRYLEIANSWYSFIYEIFLILLRCFASCCSLFPCFNSIPLSRFAILIGSLWSEETMRADRSHRCTDSTMSVFENMDQVGAFLMFFVAVHSALSELQ